VSRGRVDESSEEGTWHSEYHKLWLASHCLGNIANTHSQAKAFSMLLACKIQCLDLKDNSWLDWTQGITTALYF